MQCGSRENGMNQEANIGELEATRHTVEDALFQNTAGDEGNSSQVAGAPFVESSRLPAASSRPPQWESRVAEAYPIHRGDGVHPALSILNQLQGGNEVNIGSSANNLHAEYTSAPSLATLFPSAQTSQDKTLPANANARSMSNEPRTGKVSTTLGTPFEPPAWQKWPPSVHIHRNGAPQAAHGDDAVYRTHIHTTKCAEMEAHR
ncbi:hypothetical protein FGB62_145g03 [Gracilaria domingensis]|nr:hypothetical protein FGB62_145g03 [Gracilaria domingensis]